MCSAGGGCCGVAVVSFVWVCWSVGGSVELLLAAAVAGSNGESTSGEAVCAEARVLERRLTASLATVRPRSARAGMVRAAMPPTKEGLVRKAVRSKTGSLYVVVVPSAS